MHSVSALVTRRAITPFSRKRLTRHLSIMTSTKYNSEEDQTSLTAQLAADLVDGQSSSNGPIRACIAIAGGGSNAASAITSTPGASSLLLESLVTYDRRSFAEFVTENIDINDEDEWLSELESDSMGDTGSNISDTSSNANGSFHFASAQAAVLLSKSALRRSLQLSPSFQDRCLHCCGVGSASALVGLPSPNADVDDRRKKRKSRAYVACSTLRDGTTVWEVELSNGCGENGTDQINLHDKRTRSQEESIVSNIILAAMVNRRDHSNTNTSVNRSPWITQILKRKGDTIEEKWFGSKCNQSEPSPTQSPSIGAHRIINGESNIVAVLPVQEKMEALYMDDQIPLTPDILVVPGSFNPPHIGHAQLANAGVLMLRFAPSNLLSILNIYSILTIPSLG